MPKKRIEPVLGLDSFNCPHCGALAHQSWFKLYVDSYGKDDRPNTPPPDIVERIEKNKEFNDDSKADLIAFFKKMLGQRPFFESENETRNLRTRLENCSVSVCYSCKEVAIWIFSTLKYPNKTSLREPNEDLPDDIKLDFDEASWIVDVSPRGAAALLRLCIQKVCIALGEKGRSIDDDIANLVAKGLDPQLQRALDIVRVIGNEAVHPGQIDLRDQPDTAEQLFELVNLIAETMISRPKKIDAIYSKLPPTKLKAIEQRDAAKD